MNLNDDYNSCKLFEYNDILNILSNDIVVDICAGAGFFERYCYLKNASKIICFEPNKNKFELLKLNVSEKTIIFNSEPYSIDYIFESELITNIDLLKIDYIKNEKIILNSINERNLQKINKISIKWYDFEILDDNEKNLIVNYYLERGFNCWVNINMGFALLYIYKK